MCPLRTFISIPASEPASIKYASLTCAHSTSLHSSTPSARIFFWSNSLSAQRSMAAARFRLIVLAGDDADNNDGDDDDDEDTTDVVGKH